MSVNTEKFVAAYRDTKKNTAEFVRVVNEARVGGMTNKEIFVEIRDALNAAGEMPAKSLENSISHYARAGQVATVAILNFADDVALHAAWQISTGRVKVKGADEFAAEFATKKPKDRTAAFVKGVKSLIVAADAAKRGADSEGDPEGEGDAEGSETKAPKPVSIDRMLEAIRLFVADASDDDVEMARIDLIADAIRKGQADRAAK